MLHTFQYHWLEASPITGERTPSINNNAQTFVCFVYRMVVVRRGLWPLPSPPLKPWVFFLWVMLKDKEYSSNHHTDHDPKNSIRVAAFSFSPADTPSVIKQCVFRMWGMCARRKEIFAACSQKVVNKTYYCIQRIELKLASSLLKQTKE
jgi:hypothetical protein